jgi:hypothetical protein
METEMRPLIRLLLTAALPLLLAAPAAAQQGSPPATAAPDGAAPEAAEEAPWQTVITHQIEAFREGDALVALSFAATPFHKQFSDPFAFMAAIFNSGYSPIFLSQSHSFGQFQRLAPGSALQVVRFVGPKQEVFEAVYEMTEEAEGWRVAGVMLLAPKGTQI